jgi:hypothetical protein
MDGGRFSGESRRRDPLHGLHTLRNAHGTAMFTNQNEKDSQTLGRGSGPRFQHHPESGLAAHHPGIGIGCALQWILLDQRQHAGDLAELERIL